MLFAQNSKVPFWQFFTFGKMAFLNTCVKFKESFWPKAISIQVQFNFSFFFRSFFNSLFFFFYRGHILDFFQFFFYFFQFGNFKDIYELGYNHATTYLAGMRKLK